MATRSPRLLRLYEKILSYLWLSSDEQGKVLDVAVDPPRPYHIDNKQVLLPTDENLRNFKREEQIIFHPFREHADRGESDILKSLRGRFNSRINCAILALMTDLMELVCSKDQHRDLSPEQRDLLTSVGAMSDSVPQEFVKLCAKTFASQTNRFFTNVYLKKAGTIKGVKYSRVGVVQFPFFELLDNPGVDIKQEHLDAIRNVFNFIFPNAKDDPEEYYDYSNSHDAPWLEAFLKTSAKLAGRVAELQELYRDYISSAEKLSFSVQWLEELDDMEGLRKEIMLIPAQSGNNGEPIRETVAAAPAARQTAAPTPAAPAAQSAVPVPERSGRITYDEAALAPTPPAPAYPPAQPAYPPYPAAPGYPPHPPGYPPYPPAAYPAPYPAASPAPSKPTTTPDGKLDFNSILATSPQVAAGMVAATPLSAPPGWGPQPGMHQGPQAGGQPMIYDPRTGQWYPDQRYAPLPTAPAPSGWGYGNQPSYNAGYYRGGYSGARDI